MLSAAVAGAKVLRCPVRPCVTVTSSMVHSGNAPAGFEAQGVQPSLNGWAKHNQANHVVHIVNGLVNTY
jgi:hypothetical protein